MPAERLPEVRNANEETLLDLADYLPKEAAEALHDLATGSAPQVVMPALASLGGFEKDYRPPQGTGEPN